MTRYAAFGAVSFLALVSCGQPTTDVATTDTSLIPPLVIERSEPPDWSRVPPATTTTTPPRRASRLAVRPRSRSVEPPSAGRAASSGDLLDRLAQCESPTGRDSSNGRYHGYFQFLLSTWRSLGYSGDPHTYPYEVQKEAARRLIERSGWGQFPSCARRLRML